MGQAKIGKPNPLLGAEPDRDPGGKFFPSCASFLLFAAGSDDQSNSDETAKISHGLCCWNSVDTHTLVSACDHTKDPNSQICDMLEMITDCCEARSSAGPFCPCSEHNG